jgi:hypothetical protein
MSLLKGGVQDVGEMVVSPMSSGLVVAAGQATPMMEKAHRLWAAAVDGDAEAVDQILRDRSVAIDRDILDMDGTTALHKASQNGHLAVVKLLLAGSRKANVNATFNDGGVRKNAKDVALENGHSEVAAYLGKKLQVTGASAARKGAAAGGRIKPMQEYLRFRRERGKKEHRDYLLKDYEGFLAPKLSDGAVEFQEHWEISDYRMKRGVDKAVHQKALENLGWNVSRYMTSLQEHAESSYQMEVAVLQVALNHETTLEKKGKDDFDSLSPEEQEGVIKERWDFLSGVMKSTFIEDEEISWDEYLYIRRVRMLYGVSDDELKHHICQWCFVDRDDFQTFNERGYTEQDKKNAENTPTSKTREQMLRNHEDTETQVFNFMKKEWASCSQWYPRMLDMYHLGIGVEESHNREPRYRDRVHTDTDDSPGQVKVIDNKPLLFAYKNQGSDSNTLFQEPHLKPWVANATVTKLPSDADPSVYTVEHEARVGTTAKSLQLPFVQMQTKSDYMCLLGREHVRELKWEMTKKITSIVLTGSERDRSRNGTYDLVEGRRICNRPYFMTRDERNHLYFHEGISRTDCKWVITSRRPEKIEFENPKKGQHYARLQDSAIIPYRTEACHTWESTDRRVKGALTITPKGGEDIEIKAPTVIDPPFVADKVTVGGDMAMQMNLAGTYTLRQYKSMDQGARLVCERPYYLHDGRGHHLYYDGEQHRWVITSTEPKVHEIGTQYLMAKDLAKEPTEIRGRWDLCQNEAGRAGAGQVTLGEAEMKLSPKGVRVASQEKADRFDELATDFRRALMALSWWYHATQAEAGDKANKSRTKQKAFATQWQWWLAEHQRKVEARTRLTSSEVYVTDDEARMIKKRGIALAQRNRTELLEKKEKKKKDEERQKKEQEKLEAMITVIFATRTNHTQP